MILRNVGLMRHGVYLCVAAALVDIHFVVVKQRQEPFGSLGLSRSIDYRDRFFVQLGHFFVSVGAQHGASQKLIHSVADMRKAEHAYVVYIAFLHPRAEIIVHISLQIKQGRSHYVNRPCVLHIVDLVGKLCLNLQRFGGRRALSGLHFEPLVARYEYLARL